MRFLSFILFLFTCIVQPLFAEEEPLENSALVVNQELNILRKNLKEKFNEVALLHKKGGSPEQFSTLLDEINSLKASIIAKEEEWQESSSTENTKNNEGYAFWDQGETTLGQLIMEYGSCDFLYIIPHELSSVKLQMFSSLPIPHESWNEMIDLILAQNGIGIKKLNPFLKELFLFKSSPFIVEAIVDSVEHLQTLSNNAWVFYIMSPPVEQIRSMQSFFERFADIKQTNIYVVGNKLIIASLKENVEKLLELQKAIWGKDQGKVLRVYKLAKLSVQEGEKILKSFFQDTNTRGQNHLMNNSPDELTIVALPYGALIFMGEQSCVSRAEKILEDLENQLDDPQEDVLFWYTCKHSDPQDIVAVLEKIYGSLSSASTTSLAFPEIKNSDVPTAEQLPPHTPIPSVVLPQHGKKEEKNSSSFIVDPKTGSIVMVVKKTNLPKIKSLLKKLDVPKKMVQIDVLLVEKRMQDQKNSGINLLKIGTNKLDAKNNTSDKDGTFFSFDGSPVKKGLLEFLISRAKGDFPPFDLTLNFLMAQQDIHIHSNPSVLAVNNTPATIYVVEEMSINNGAIPIDINKDTHIEKSYSRAQFGITISMTPIVHLGDEDEEGREEKGFITLQTNVTFDSVQPSQDNRPDVTKRHIENEVRIADGETIILGGLRKKIGEDTREKIPFLGDLPGIGKLFGNTHTTDSATEMYIFITPKIIKNPVDDLRRVRKEELSKRAGDTPTFLKALDEAKKNEHKKLFTNSLKLLFDKP